MTDWTPHNGGPCPVDPETLVEVRLRAGEINQDRAKDYDWSDDGNQYAITAYRLLPPEPNWREIADELAAALTGVMEWAGPIAGDNIHPAVAQFEAGTADRAQAALTTYNQAKER